MTCSRARAAGVIAEVRQTVNTLACGYEALIRRPFSVVPFISTITENRLSDFDNMMTHKVSCMSYSSLR